MREWLWSHSQGGHTSGGKNVKERKNGKQGGKGKRGWGYVKAIAVQVEPRKKKNRYSKKIERTRLQIFATI